MILLTETKQPSSPSRKAPNPPQGNETSNKSGTKSKKQEKKDQVEFELSYNAAQQKLLRQQALYALEQDRQKKEHDLVQQIKAQENYIEELQQRVKHLTLPKEVPSQLYQHMASGNPFKDPGLFPVSNSRKEDTFELSEMDQAPSRTISINIEEENEPDNACPSMNNSETNVSYV